MSLLLLALALLQAQDLPDREIGLRRVAAAAAEALERARAEKTRLALEGLSPAERFDVAETLARRSGRGEAVAALRRTWSEAWTADAPAQLRKALANALASLGTTERDAKLRTLLYALQAELPAGREAFEEAKRLSKCFRITREAFAKNRDGGFESLLTKVNLVTPAGVATIAELFLPWSEGGTIQNLAMTRLAIGRDGLRSRMIIEEQTPAQGHSWRKVWPADSENAQRLIAAGETFEVESAIGAAAFKASVLFAPEADPGACRLLPEIVEAVIRGLPETR